MSNNSQPCYCTGGIYSPTCSTWFIMSCYWQLNLKRVSLIKTALVTWNNITYIITYSSWSLLLPKMACADKCMILNFATVLYKNCKGPICSLASVYKPSFTIFLTFCTKHGELKLTTKPFAGRTLRGLLLAKFGHAQKAKFREFLGLKVTQQSWLLLFAFSPPFFFRFSCLIFFFSCWAFSRLHFGGKSF